MRVSRRQLSVLSFGGDAVNHFVRLCIHGNGEERYLIIISESETTGDVPWNAYPTYIQLPTCTLPRECDEHKHETKIFSDRAGAMTGLHRLRVPRGIHVRMDVIRVAHNSP